MEHRSRRGLRRLRNATRFSLSGLRDAWRHEPSFRFEVQLFALAVPLTFWLGDNVIEYCLLLGSFLILMLTELLNSGIESLSDRISTEHHELSRRAKDLGSAAVFLGIMLVLLVWGMLLCEKVF
ncbi:MAG: diacylglycerol kinase [Gammaproteobacteria bacterium]|nr:diacylglycerol kinase [Gammaproteobacteria bacterium]